MNHNDIRKKIEDSVKRAARLERLRREQAKRERRLLMYPLKDENAQRRLEEIKREIAEATTEGSPAEFDIYA